MKKPHLAVLAKLENILDTTFSLVAKHGDALATSIVGVLEAKREELTGRAELHRATALNAGAPPIRLGGTTAKEEEFYACPDREAEAIFADVLDPRRVPCEKHDKKKHEACPRDEDEKPAELLPIDMPPLLPEPPEPALRVRGFESDLVPSSERQHQLHDGGLQ